MSRLRLDLSSLKLLKRHFVNVYWKPSTLFHSSVWNLQTYSGRSTPNDRRLKSKFSANITKTIVEETIASVKNSPPEIDSNDVVPHWVQTPIDYQIYYAKNLDELLNLAEKYRITGAQCVSFLARLCNFMPLNVEKLQQDVRFQLICDVLNEEIKFFTPGSIILALRSLLFLKVSETSPSNPLAQLRNAVRHLTRLRVPPSTLVPFACFHVDYAENSESGRILQNELENFMKLNLGELNDAKLILMMLSKIRQDKDFTKRLELRALDMVDSMTSDQLTLLLQHVSNAKSRNINLLKAAGKKICDANKVIPVKHLILLLQAANRLSYYEQNFLKRICDDLEIQVKTIDKHYFVGQLCNEIGIGRLRHEKILTDLIETTSKIFDFCQPSTLCSLIIMLARCNFTLTNDVQKDFLIKIRDYISFDMVKDHAFWLDYVWALAILQILTSKEAGSVLDKKFYENLINNKDEFRSLIVRLKLLNVNTSAKLELKNYNGPFLADIIIKSLPSPTNHTMSKYKKSELDFFSDAFTSVPDKFLVRSRISPEGYIIDFETRTDSAGKLLPVEKWDEQSKEHIKIAFLIWNLFDKTKVTDTLWGLNAMAVRHLELSGYKVIQILVKNMTDLKTPLARTQYLNKLFEDSIRNKSTAVQK